jgi:hypothetical protein
MPESIALINVGAHGKWQDVAADGTFLWGQSRSCGESVFRAFGPIRRRDLVSPTSSREGHLSLTNIG